MKFRGQETTSKKWVYGSLAECAGPINKGKTYILPTTTSIASENGAFSLGGFIEVDPDSVGFYVGVDDKTGKEIFTGDVVRTRYGRLCVVVWFKPKACIDFAPIMTEENLEKKVANPSDTWYPGYLKVVGTLFEGDYADNMEKRRNVSLKP